MTRHPGTTPAATARASRLLRKWGPCWGLPGIEAVVTVSFSRRLRRSLGRCTPARGHIVLNVWLTSGAPRRFAAVLCHEAAHVAAFLLYGRAIRPHGSEWAALVRAAGYSPELRTAVPRSIAAPRREMRRPTLYRMEHRCPVCQSMRWARRPMPGWRCTDCLAAGLDGAMIIVDHAAGRGA
jgi:SprT protein